MTLSDRLAAFGVTQVVMEATGVYWKPVWAVLEDTFDCMLVNARRIKHREANRLHKALEDTGTSSNLSHRCCHPALWGSEPVDHHFRSRRECEHVD